METYGKICIYLLRVHFKKRSVNDLFNDVYDFFLVFFIQVDAIQMGTHNICFYEEADKIHGCNLKTMKFLTVHV